MTQPQTSQIQVTHLDLGDGEEYRFTEAARDKLEEYGGKFSAMIGLEAKSICKDLNIPVDVAHVEIAYLTYKSKMPLRKGIRFWINLISKTIGLMLLGIVIEHGVQFIQGSASFMQTEIGMTYVLILIGSFCLLSLSLLTR